MLFRSFQFSVYAFSTENWKRPLEEVSAIVGLLKKYLLESIEKMEKDKIKLHFFGDLEPLPQELKDMCRKTSEISERYEGMQVNVMLVGACDDGGGVRRSLSQWTFLIAR